MIQATDAIIGYRKELGDTVDEEEVWNECGKDMNKTAEEVAKTFQKVSNTENEVAKQTENTSKKVETLSEKYKRLNNQLAENESAIAAVKAEIEEVQDEIDRTEDVDEIACNSAKEHLEELQKKLKELNSNQTELQKRIKAVKDEIEKDANTIADAIGNVEDSAQMLAKAEKEVTDNGKLSLNTFSAIQKKYPELTDLVNDYISGIKTEKDVIEGLKAVYDKDVENYNQALAFKKLKQEDYTKDVTNTSAELVNKYKDHYGIDLKNFISVVEAKKAALKELKRKAEEAQDVFNTFWAENNFDISYNNGVLSYIAKDSKTGQWREANADEIKHYKEILEKRDKIFDDYYDFNENDFQKQLEEDLSKYYKPVSADTLLSFSNTNSGSSKNDSRNGSGGSSDKSKNSVTLSGGGVSATADTYTSAYISWINRMKALGRMSTEQEISHLESLKKRTDNTADEIYSIELALYQAKNKLAEESASKQTEIEKKRAEQEKQAADELQERLNLAKAAYDKLVNGKIEAYQKEAQAAKDAADEEIAALNRVLKKRKEEKEDADRQEKLNQINAQLRYKQMNEFSRQELLRQKQDLLNEQAEIDFERNITAQKEAIQARADSVQDKSQQAIDGLNAAQSQFSDHLAYLQGNQSYDQRVANNTTNQNVQIVQNGLNGDQVVAKLLKALGVS